MTLPFSLSRYDPWLTASLFAPICSALQAKYPADPLNPDATNVSAGYAFVIMTWIFNFAFSLGIGPISWAVPPAIFTTGIRSKGTALSSMSAWIASEFSQTPVGTVRYMGMILADRRNPLVRPRV